MIFSPRTGLGVLLVCLAPILLRAGGTVTTCDEASLRVALNGGGTVTLACDGTITLVNTIVISADTAIDASGHAVTISGNNSVRVFYVNGGISLSLQNLAVANGQYRGADSPVGVPGGDAKGGGLYNDG